MKKVNRSAVAPKKTDRKPPKSAWAPGQSGNPAGRAPGTLNKATLMAAALLEQDLEAITSTIVSAALDGDMAAAKFIVERMVPAVRERPLQIQLPETNTAAGIDGAQQAILAAVACGDLLPGEATSLASIVEQRRKAIETQEILIRLTHLERVLFDKPH